MLIGYGFLFFTVIMLGFYFFLLWQEESRIRKTIKSVDALSQKFITLVEQEKYISPKVKSEIMKEFGDNFYEVEIDGTLEPVEKGERVYLILSVARRSTNGGYSFKKRFVLEGTAQ